MNRTNTAKTPKKGKELEKIGRRELKKRVEAILDGDFQQQGEELLHYPLKSLLNPLFIALCHRKEHIRWNAVAAFGLIVPKIAENNMEDGRIVMRRFLWSLNDESGGIGWGAPEAMAAVMAASEPLRKEYLHMLISYMEDDGEELFEDGNFLELPMLQRGLLWGMGQLCQAFPDIADERVREDIAFYLGSEDNETAAMALWALNGAGVKIEATHLDRFLQDTSPLTIFSLLNGKRLEKTTPAELAKQITKE